MTFSIMTLSITMKNMTLRIMMLSIVVIYPGYPLCLVYRLVYSYADCRYVDYGYAGCVVSFIVMLSADMLNAVMLSVSFVIWLCWVSFKLIHAKGFICFIVMLIVVMLIPAMLSVSYCFIVMLSAIMLNAVKLSVVMLNAVNIV